jgi:hypothetical protein
MSRHKDEEKTPDEVAEEVNAEQTENAEPSTTEDETVSGDPASPIETQNPDIKVPEGHAEALEKGYIGDQVKDTEANG